MQGWSGVSDVDAGFMFKPRRLNRSTFMFMSFTGRAVFVFAVYTAHTRWEEQRF